MYSSILFFYQSSEKIAYAKKNWSVYGSPTDPSSNAPTLAFFLGSGKNMFVSPISENMCS